MVRSHAVFKDSTHTEDERLTALGALFFSSKLVIEADEIARIHTPRL